MIRSGQEVFLQAFSSNQEILDFVHTYSKAFSVNRDDQVKFVGQILKSPLLTEANAIKIIESLNIYTKEAA